MKQLMVKRSPVGFILSAVALIASVVAFVLYLMTFDAFHYVTDRQVTTLMIVALWCTNCITAVAVLYGTGLLPGEEPVYIDILRIVSAFCMTLATLKFLIPCLSPIGIYFTVHNMGDVEANAIGVPRSIACVVFCVISIVLMIVSAFFGNTKKQASTVEHAENVESVEDASTEEAAQ